MFRKNLWFVSVSTKERRLRLDNGETNELDDLKRRLDIALEKNSGANSQEDIDSSKNGKGQALRISTELIVAVGVGGGLGFFLDNLLGTKPWLLIVFLLLGNAAGLWNIYRLLNGKNYRVGLNHKK
ncbi:MAG: F0F1 ATP synthase subunit I [Rhodospirillaceae bacterium]|nr:F0F1 ATP synthase subunit I [Rhodospirillaceae bacterium]